MKHWVHGICSFIPKTACLWSNSTQFQLWSTKSMEFVVFYIELHEFEVNEPKWALCRSNCSFILKTLCFWSNSPQFKLWSTESMEFAVFYRKLLEIVVNQQNEHCIAQFAVWYIKLHVYGVIQLNLNFEALSPWNLQFHT